MSIAMNNLMIRHQQLASEGASAKQEIANHLRDEKTQKKQAAISERVEAAETAATQSLISGLVQIAGLGVGFAAPWLVAKDLVATVRLGGQLGSAVTKLGVDQTMGRASSAAQLDAERLDLAAEGLDAEYQEAKSEIAEARQRGRKNLETFAQLKTEQIRAQSIQG